MTDRHFDEADRLIEVSELISNDGMDNKKYTEDSKYLVLLF